MQSKEWADGICIALRLRQSSSRRGHRQGSEAGHDGLYRKLLEPIIIAISTVSLEIEDGNDCNRNKKYALTDVGNTRARRSASAGRRSSMRAPPSRTLRRSTSTWARASSASTCKCTRDYRISTGMSRVDRMAYCDQEHTVVWRGPCTDRYIYH